MSELDTRWSMELELTDEANRMRRAERLLKVFAPRAELVERLAPHSLDGRIEALAVTVPAPTGGSSADALEASGAITITGSDRSFKVAIAAEKPVELFYCELIHFAFRDEFVEASFEC